MSLLSGKTASSYSQYTADQLIGNGSQTVFSLSRTPPSPAALIVTIDGIKQHSSTYSVGSNQITFSEAPPSGSSIECTAIGSPGIAYEPTDGSITAQKLAGEAVTTVKIADSAITTSKIADGSLTASKYDSLSSNGTGGLAMPSGTTAQRPLNPPNGTARYNTDFRCVEYYYNTFWLTADPSQQPTMPVGSHIWSNNQGTGYIASIGKSWTARGEQTSDLTWVVPAGVYWIFVKLWGAGGGGGAYGGWRQGSNGGGGGYTQAIIPVVPGETMTTRVGQRGYSRWGANRAYPDGGGSSTGGGDNQYTAAGGGSSSVKIPSVSSEYCLFAGGGGGGGSVTGYAFNSGGAGGGLQGQPGARTAYTQSNGTNFGGGGQQTTGGRAGSGNNTSGGAGSFKQGGTHQNGNCYGGGGGGGWYGGGSGAYGGSSMGGGGGGSGYVHPSLTGMTMTGSGNIPANHTDVWLGRFVGQDDLQYARGGEEDGYGGPGLMIWWW
jgi:hypothetical protein